MGRQLSPVVLHAAEDSATIYVLSDYVAIGGDGDYLSMPLIAGGGRSLPCHRMFAADSEDR